MNFALHNICQLFVLNSSLYKEKIAVRDGKTQLSYNELNQSVTKLAIHLIKRGATPGSYIPLLMHKNNDLIVSILAVLKIGAAYVPLDPDSLPKFIKSVLQETEAKYILTSSFLETLLDKNNLMCDRVFVDEILSNQQEDSDTSEFIFPSIMPNSPAYLMYTSGSTGAPKGVVVTHHNLMSVYKSWQVSYNLCKEDIHLQMAHIAFDVFIGDFCRALGSGATLVLCSREMLLNSQKLYSLLISERVSVAEFVPAVLKELLSYLNKNNLKLPPLRLLICGSDQWTLSEYRSVRQYCSVDTRIINSYGLTETTIDSTYFEETPSTMQETLSSACITPIGKPFSHAEVFILDETMQPVVFGEAGEIYISGEGVSAGYFNQQEMTKQRFLTSKDSNKTRMFRTGDIGYQLANGNIVILGRNEFHFKINGMRLSAYEMESWVKQNPIIRDCFVMPYYVQSQLERLDFYCRCIDESLTYEGLLAWIQQKWPFLNIPCHYHIIKDIPLSSRGKVHRVDLPKKVVYSLVSLLSAPKNAQEKELLLIWQKLLQVKKIGINTNFFAAGGSSLLAVAMLEHVNQHFGVNIVYNTQVSTIENLVKKIRHFSTVDNFPLNSRNASFENQRLPLVNEYSKGSLDKSLV